ncbi:MAG: hypothetical protein HND47_10880 [Chloroflexi bacterium]|nr:hypothetical protein [Chloroflexota bacterium]
MTRSLSSSVSPPGSSFGSSSRAPVRSGTNCARTGANSAKPPKAAGTNTVEENHRRATLRRAQGMHLAAPLFALDEIILEPLLLAPPPKVEPGTPPKFRRRRHTDTALPAHLA